MHFRLKFMNNSEGYYAKIAYEVTKLNRLKKNLSSFFIPIHDIIVAIIYKDQNGVSSATSTLGILSLIFFTFKYIFHLNTFKNLLKISTL